MRSRLTLTIAAAAILAGFALTGCGDDSAITKATNAASAGATAASAGATAKTGEAAAGATSASGAKPKSVPAAKAKPRNGNGLSIAEIRTRCLKNVKKKVKTESLRDSMIIQCNNAYKLAIRTYKKQRRQLRKARADCFKEAEATTDAKKRERILIGCNSIPLEP